MTESWDNPTIKPRVRSFTGSYERAVDRNGRFNLPFRFRRPGTNGEPEALVATLGINGNLSIYLEEVWDDVFTTAKANAKSDQALANLLHMSEHACDFKPDTQGRITIPAKLLEMAGIGKKALVLGMGDHMELWDGEAYGAYKREHMKVDREFLRNFFA